MKLTISLLFFFPFLVSAQWNTYAEIGENPLGNASIWATSENVIHWVGEASGKVAKSTDGGKTWTTQILPGDAGIGTFTRDIYFISSNTGFIVGAINAGEYCIWRTDNGGDSWSLELIDFFSGFGSLRAIQFVDPLNGYIVGGANIILKTIDGGENWTRSRIEYPFEKNLIALDFIDKNTGFVLSSNFTFFRTADGGLTWEEYDSSFFGTRSDIHFFDAQNGFGLERNDGLYKTSDGGKNWELVEQFSGLKESMWWQDDQIGYVNTNTGDIYKTIDGGEHWLQQNKLVNRSISDIFFLNPNVGWAIVEDNSGTILKTTNAGGIGLNIIVEEEEVCTYDTLFLRTHLIGTSNLHWELNGEFFSNERNPIFIPQENGTFEFKAIATEGSQSLSQLYEFTPIAVSLDEDLALDLAYETVCIGSTVDLNYSGVESFGYNYRLEINGELFGDERRPTSRKLEWTIDALTENSSFSLRKYHPTCGWVEQLERTVQVVEPPLTNLELEIPRNPVCARDRANVIVLNAQKGVGYQVLSEGFAQNSVRTAPEDADFLLTINRRLESAELKVEASRTKGCTRIIEDSISLDVITLSPSFSVDALNVPIDSPLTIHNTSPDSLDFEWIISNGTTSTAMDPNPVTFLEEKEQSVHLEVTSPYGCKETLNKIINTYDPATLSDFWLQKEGTPRERNLDLWRMQIDDQGSIYYAYNHLEYNDAVYDVQTRAGEGHMAFDKVIVKKDPKGVLQWYSEINGVNEATFSINDFTLSLTNNLIALISHVGVIHINSTDGNNYESLDQRGMLIVEFTPSGVIHKVHQLTYVTPLSNQGSRDYSSGLSIEMDKDGAIFLTGRWYYSETLDELIYTNPNGVQNTINSLDQPVLNREGIGFFVAKINSEEELSWARPYYYPETSGRVRQIFRPVELKSDKSGGIYIWATGFKEESRAEYFHKVVLTKINATGEDVWTTFGAMQEDWNKERFMLANYLEVDEQGNAFVLGSVYGANFFGTHPGIQTVNAQFFSKVNANGEVQWIRYLSTPTQYGGLSDIASFGLGLAIDNGFIYVRSKKCDWASLIIFPVCHQPEQDDEGDQHISVWDTGGNLLQIFPVYNTGCSSVQNNMHPTIFDVKNEAIYLLGSVFDDEQEIVKGFSNENTGNRNYLAKIEEDKMYYPFITRPFDNTNNCYLSFYDLDHEVEPVLGAEMIWPPDQEPKALEVSKVFTNIQWLVDGVVIEGENSHKIFPKTAGEYTVRATNPVGQIVETLQPTIVNIYDRNGDLITSTTEIIQRSNLNISPNPTNKLVTISFNPGHHQRYWQISIFNTLNQPVFLKAIEANGGSIDFSYNTQDLVPGMYQIILQSSDQKEMALGKLVVAK